VKRVLGRLVTCVTTSATLKAQGLDEIPRTPGRNPPHPIQNFGKYADVAGETTTFRIKIALWGRKLQFSLHICARWPATEPARLRRPGGNRGHLPKANFKNTQTCLQKSKFLYTNSAMGPKSFNFPSIYALAGQPQRQPACEKEVDCPTAGPNSVSHVRRSIAIKPPLAPIKPPPSMYNFIKIAFLRARNPSGSRRCVGLDRPKRAVFNSL